MSMSFGCYLLRSFRCTHHKLGELIM
jgi:hypothetical protein